MEGSHPLFHSPEAQDSPPVAETSNATRHATPNAVTCPRPSPRPTLRRAHRALQGYPTVASSGGLSFRPVGTLSRELICRPHAMRCPPARGMLLLTGRSEECSEVLAQRRVRRVIILEDGKAPRPTYKRALCAHTRTREENLISVWSCGEPVERHHCFHANGGLVSRQAARRAVSNQATVSLLTRHSPELERWRRADITERFWRMHGLYRW